eukprot:scaffold10246_cov97-Skeletonema_marinoi.AAC.3
MANYYRSPLEVVDCDILSVRYEMVVQCQVDAAHMVASVITPQVVGFCASLSRCVHPRCKVLIASSRINETLT